MGTLEGQVIGNYQVGALLGAGGMGDVYRGMHRYLNRPAAIKVMHDTLAADPTFQARFQLEARAAAALHHPHIVEVFDFGEQDGRAYLVMELVPDGSLGTLLRARRAGASAWPLDVGIALVCQVAEGLAYAHAQGMVHRDIKPDNLLLQRAGAAGDQAPAGQAVATADDNAKISDFGLARLAEGSGLTATGTVMGTPAYMSPEQCQGAALDGRSDLYSLGVVLYQVVTGALPFEAKTMTDAIYHHVYTPPPPPRRVNPQLSPELEAIVLRCLAKDPAERFATGTELAAALRTAMVNAAPGAATQPAALDATRLDATRLDTPAPSADAAGPAIAQTEAEPALSPLPLSPPAAGTLALTLSQEAWPVAPGQPLHLTGTLANHSSAIEHVLVTVAGVPPGWAQGPSIEVELAAGASSALDLAIGVTNAAAGAEGEYPVAVRARSLDHAGVSATAAGRWMVTPRQPARSADPPPIRERTPVVAPVAVRVPARGAATEIAAESIPVATTAPPTVPMLPDDARPSRPVVWPTPPTHGAAERRFVVTRLGFAAGGLVLIVLAVVFLTQRFGQGPTIASQATSTAPATATAPGRVAFQDALATDSGKWGLNGTCAFADGGLQVHGAGHCYAKLAPVSDATIQVKVRQLSGPHDQFYGIVLRSVDSNHYYQFGVNADQQWVFIAWANGQPQNVVAPTHNDAIASGQDASNTLRVRAQGNQFVFFVNGKQVGAANDGRYASGQVGLKTNWSDLTVTCTDYTVWVPA